MSLLPRRTAVAAFLVKDRAANPSRYAVLVLSEGAQMHGGEIVEGGGDASLVEARFVEGLSDEQVKEMFRAARDAEYQEIATGARELARRDSHK